MGSKPADRAWARKRRQRSTTEQEEEPRVPRRFRKLRLRRRDTARRRGKRAATGSPTVEFGVGLVLLLGGVLFTVSTVTDRISWRFGLLLALSAFAGAGVFLGRAVSRARRAGRARPTDAERRYSHHLRTTCGWAVVVGGVATWLLMGEPFWGPWPLWKIAATVALTLGVEIAFDGRNAFVADGGRRTEALHAVRHRPWSPRRRWITIATFVSAIAWVSACVFVLREPEAGRYVLRPAFWLFTTLLVGVSMIWTAVDEARRAEVPVARRRIRWRAPRVRGASKAAAPPKRRRRSRMERGPWLIWLLVVLMLFPAAWWAIRVLFDLVR